MNILLVTYDVWKVCTIDPRSRPQSRSVVITILTRGVRTCGRLSFHPHFSKSYKTKQISSENSDRCWRKCGVWPRGSLMPTCLVLSGFDLNTEPCLPRARHTRHTQTAILLIIILVSSLSCIFDAYASRLRAKICNLHYCDLAEARGRDLHRRIKAGRGQRRFQLPLIVFREAKRREKLENFSWWSRILGRFNIGWVNILYILYFLMSHYI